MDSSTQKWRHSGGKLMELGPESLSDIELLAILISSGIKGKPSEKIAKQILAKFGSFKGMANQPLQKSLKIKGLGYVKTIRIAAAFEIARRIVNQRYQCEKIISNLSKKYNYSKVALCNETKLMREKLDMDY